MKKNPVNLDLTTLVFPITAIASILHRISGVVLFLLLPYIFYILDLSLRDSSGFTEVQLWLAHPYNKIVLWAFLSCAWYHAIAGIRHMLMDGGLGETLAQSRFTAAVVIGAGFLGVMVIGVWLW